jgi:uncharacterized membrane protein
MIDAHFILKLAHVIGACVLFGTGMGIAFFMWMAQRGADAARSRRSPASWSSSILCSPQPP